MKFNKQAIQSSYINPIFLTDSYKLSHISFTSKGVQVIYSNFTPRFTEYLAAKFKTFDGGIVWFGLQAAIQKIVYEYWELNFFQRNKEEVIEEAKRFLGTYIGMENLKHFEDLHDLGYLPIRIKALPEGCVISKGIPCFTITNTHDDYQWLPNYFESVFSAEVWKPMTTATIGRILKRIAIDASIETTGSAQGADFQLHDFSFRGQSGIESGAASGGGMLLSTLGTDNIPSIAWMEHYYNANIQTDEIAYSVPAGEHSVTTLGIQIEAKKILEEQQLKGLFVPKIEDVLESAERRYVGYVLNQFPTGIVSYVADSYDYFGFLEKTLPAMKDEIQARDGKFVVRGDSGDPVEIIAGINIPDFSHVDILHHATVDAAYAKIPDVVSEGGSFEVIFKHKGQIYKSNYHIVVECGQFEDVIVDKAHPYELTTQEKGTIAHLFDVFGGHVNSKGYIELNEKIGMIYGDGINESRMLEIFKRLKAQGFATTNVVFGIGSYTLNMLSRDDLGTAVKATSAVVDGDIVAIYKDPKTDTSKKSARGLLKVQQLSNGMLELLDEVSVIGESEGMLDTVFENGEMVLPTTYNEVVDNLKIYDEIWRNQLVS